MNITVVTGNRSDWGLLELLVDKMNANPDFNVSVVATGSHLSPHHGYTVEEVDPDETVEILLASDTKKSMSISMGLAMQQFPQVYRKLYTDLVLLLGDRYEIFAAATSAYTLGIPIAHIYGGEVSGNIDDAFRDCITRMSTLHFCATPDAFDRIGHIKRSSERIYRVGALGCEDLVPVLDKKYPGTLLILFHPNTLMNESFLPLSNVLKERKEEGKIFILPNCDAGGMKISDYIKGKFQSYVISKHIERNKFLDLLSNVKAIVGNSSAGIIEAPFVGTPTINIGDRQKNRAKATSVISCQNDENSIRRAFKQLDSSSEYYFQSPYFAYKNSSDTIIKILKEYQHGTSQKNN